MNSNLKRHVRSGEHFSRWARIGAIIFLLFSCSPGSRNYAQEAAIQLPEGTQEVSYKFKFEAESNIGATTWRVTGGELPPGLILDASGRLYGVPVSAKNGAYRFVIEVTDSASVPRRFSQTFALSIQPAPLRIKQPEALRIQPVTQRAASAPAAVTKPDTPLASIDNDGRGFGGSGGSGLLDNNNSQADTPAAEIITPAANDTVRVGQLELRFRVNDQNLQKFSVTVKWLGDKEKGQSDKTDVQVKDQSLKRGENEVRPVITLQPGKSIVTMTATGKYNATAELVWNLTYEPEYAREIQVPPPVEGDAEVIGMDAKPNAEIKVVRGNAELTETIMANHKGQFFWNPPARQPLAAGERLSFKQKGLGDTAFSSASDFVRVLSVEQKDDLRAGSAQGHILGGLVFSQQAQEFKQADPFIGFEAGYRFGAFRKHTEHKMTADHQDRSLDSEGYILRKAPVGDDGRVLCGDSDCHVAKLIPCDSNTGTGKCALVRVKDRNGLPVKGREAFRNTGQFQFRFFGVFQSAPRAVEPNSETTVENPVNFKPFIASRKTFDTGVRFWYEAPKFSRFYTLGLYGLWGGSTTMSKTELEGESALVQTEDKDKKNTACTVTAGSAATNNDCASKIDNDIKQFKEFGLLQKVDLFNKRLFLENTLGFGHYEALKGLAPCRVDDSNCVKHNTQNRFIGRLRIIPDGLNQDYGGQRAFSPFFGVEVNGGYGPDQVKFYIGSMIRLKGLNF
jgi:Putative Ig domain